MRGDRQVRITGHRMISSVFWPDSTISVPVEACHGFFAKNTKRFFYY